MAQVTEQRSSAAQPNIQDVFLNYARRDRLAVVIHLLDGRQFEGRIKNFDRFAVIVEVNGADRPGHNGLNHLVQLEIIELTGDK